MFASFGEMTLDLCDVMIGEFKIIPADHSIQLMRRTNTDDCTGYRGIAERPGNCDFSRRTVILQADTIEQIG